MQEKRPNDSKQHLFTCSSSEGRSTDGWLVNYCSSPFWVFIKLHYENFQCSQQPHPDIWISSVLTVGNFDSELQFIPLRADLSFYLGSFYKQFHMHLFQSKSFVKFFPNFKLESNFFPHFFNLIRNIESCAHLFIMNFK